MSIRRLAVAAALGAACSTLAPASPDECAKDQDCPIGHVCSSNGDCFVNTLPEPAVIGLDVVSNAADGTFHLELRGTDKAVDRIIDEKPNRFRVGLNNARGDSDPDTDTDGDPDDPSGGVRDKLKLSVLERYSQQDPAAEVPMVAAALELSQRSRLRRDPIKASTTFALVDDEDNPILRPEKVVPWARYNLDADVAADFPLVLTIRPVDTHTINADIFRGPVHRQLARKQLNEATTHDFAVPTRRECHRNVHGNIVVGDNAGYDGTVGVEFTHFHSPPDPGVDAVCDASTDVQAVCSPDTIFRNELPSCSSANDCPPPYGCYPDGDAKRCGCSRDSECHTGQICDLTTHLCALDLLGLPATTGGITTLAGQPNFDAWIYTYCEQDLEANRELAFLVRTSPAAVDDGDPATPAPPAPLPALTFEATVDFPADQIDTIQIPGNLCFPAWESPQPVAVELESAPQEVFRDATDRPWLCCSTDCLNQKLEAPPPVPSTCPLTGDLTARTLHVQDPAFALAHSCLPLADLGQPDPPDVDQQWVLGGKIKLDACVGVDPATCQIPLSRGEPDGSREYEIRLEPPVGSLVRSMAYTATVGDGPATLPPPDRIGYRVQIHGSVGLEVDANNPACIDDGGIDPLKCVVKAEVLAERIRLPDDVDADVLGPYFYTTRTIDGSDSGEFVLAVNPGVYLLTALPEIGSPGGPAKISVVDLRLDAERVETHDGIPTATLEGPLLLAPKGQFVIVELGGFDSASVASPVDLGNWAGLRFEGRDLDLNDPRTCFGDADRACAIRRLRPGNSGLALTQEQFVKFITRCPLKPLPAGSQNPGCGA